MDYRHKLLWKGGQFWTPIGGHFSTPIDTEAAKKHLSDHPFARIEEEYLTEVGGKPIHLSMELARDDYEAMIAPYVQGNLQAIQTALRSADLTASQVEKMLLVGGATRTPLIRRRLVEVFGHGPRGEVDADLCVALGTANAGADVSAVLVDVTPHTFGTSALGELDGEIYPYRYVPIIPRNTPIPVRKSEVFYTIRDNQTEVDVRIFQGEHADALENIQIGEFRVEGLSKAAGGQRSGVGPSARPRRHSPRHSPGKKHRPGAADQH